MSESVYDSRRVFLQKLLAGTAAGGALAAAGPMALGAMEGGTDHASATDSGAQAEDYAFVVDIGKCIGCGYCVQACARENQVPEGVNRTWVERYVGTAQGFDVDAVTVPGDSVQPISEELKAEALWTAFVPKLCNHCENAPCVQVCPVGATFIAPGGFVLVDPEHCIGCGYCVQACPYGARFLNPETQTADKCTWCYHRVSRGQKPACVTVCPTGARDFGLRDDPEGPIAKVLAEDRWRVLKPDMHTASRAYYLGLPRGVI